jgi:quercetin dioxygenase-like cupin family protein
VTLPRWFLSVAPFVLVSACAETAPPPGPPPDAMAAAPARYSIVSENSAVRILKINYGPGDKSPAHRHPDAIVVALTDTNTRFTLPDGTTRDAVLTRDTANYMSAETHAPENVGTTPMEAVLVEFKTDAPGMAILPASREGLRMTVLAEGPRATAYRMQADATFAEPAGTAHEYDQVVIALGTAQVELTIGGQATKSSWARGDVQFIGRGVPHEAKNTGGTPADMVIVAIR